jgi:prepilin-type processing-associated H-X9-DG protein
MDSSVGTVDTLYAQGGTDHGGKTAATSGPWLNGDRANNKHNDPYATFGKTGDFTAVSSSQIFMTVDESPWSINDACFGVSYAISQIVDWPATYHAGACGFSFCDGHAEIHKWRTGHMTLTAPASVQAVSGDLIDLMPDWNWFAGHSTIKVQ